MMKKLFLCLFLSAIVSSSFYTTTKAFAIEDPRLLPNNKFGIHILFPSEIQNAAKLVNSSGGDWGYVIIPMQSTDRDMLKWQSFFDAAKLLHITPIIRLATDGDYFNTKVWRKPSADDVLDFANFLSSLDWPTKNRYVTIFNEVNRADEWGGSANPEEYAQLLSYAVTVFKSKNEDFFIISAGMDNAAPNSGTEYMNEYSFYQQMQSAVPGVFAQVDGIASHSYPNPGFSQPPSTNTTKSVYSFLYEKQLLDSYANKSLPVFITETGWTAENISDETRAAYYQEAIKNVWSDPNIVAITPFLLQGSGGPFEKFTFIKPDQSETMQYQAYKNISKIKGLPTIGMSETKVLGLSNHDDLEVKKFGTTTKKKEFRPSQIMTGLFTWIMKL
jgi:hypothetical protein